MTRLTISLLTCALACALPSTGSLFSAEPDSVRAEKPKAAKKKPVKRYIVLTKNGKVFQGDVVAESPKDVRLRLKSGKATRILRNDIESIRVIGTKKTKASKLRTAQAARNAAAAKADAAAKAKLRAQLQTAARLRLLELQATQQARLLAQRRGVTSGTRGVREKVDLKDNTEQLLLLSPGGPVLVELEITLNGKPFRTKREALISEMLNQSDTDKDGTVTWKEALDNPRFAFGRFSTAARNNILAYRKATIKSYDVDKDGKVSRYEVRLILSLTYGAALRFSTNYYAPKQPDVKKVLDTNKDGLITADELKVAPGRLKSRDANDNDLLESFEIGGSGNRSPYGGLAQSRFRGVRLPTKGQETFLMGPTADLAAIYSAIVTKYGGEDKEVTADAFRVCPEVFKTLDLNKSGVLDSGESIGLHLIKPMATLKIELAETDKHTRGVTLNSMTKRLSREGTGDKPNQLVSLSMPGWKMRYRVPTTTSRRADYTRTAQSLIVRYDKDKNGYIEKKEMGTNTYYQRQFTRWDANSDGKVYVDEIKAMYDQMQVPRRSQIVVVTSTQGPSLFAALDTSGDNRLSAREMRNADTRLLTIDKNKNGRIDPDEMPGELVLTFTQGGTSQVAYSRSRRSTPARIRGPRWFVHMDKNSDGDITLREFLGTRKKFKELDTNNDGFIERKEAEAVGKKAATSKK